MSYSSENPQNGNPPTGPDGPSQNQPYGSPSYGGQAQPGQSPAPQYSGVQNPGAQHQQPTYAPQGTGPQGPEQPGGPRRGSGDAGFFAALFDIRFKNFITIKFASFLYIAGLVLLTLGWLVLTIAMFATEGAGQGLLTLIIGFILLIIYVVLLRLGLEFYVAMVRTAQNTSILVERGRG